MQLTMIPKKYIDSGRNVTLFGKNLNDVSYSGSNKHWADVIKNTGSGEFLIWRQPGENSNTNSSEQPAY